MAHFIREEMEWASHLFNQMVETLINSVPQSYHFYNFKITLLKVVYLWYLAGLHIPSQNNTQSCLAEVLYIILK